MKNSLGIEDELIVLTKQTVDLFKKQKNPGDLIALYVEYLYVAKWQKTNQPRATISYVCKALNWGEDKVRAVKKQLVKLGLIEDIRHVNEKTGKVDGWYIKMNYILKRETTAKIKNHPRHLPECGSDHSVVSKGTNALRALRGNALSSNTESGGMILTLDEEQFSTFCPRARQTITENQNPENPFVWKTLDKDLRALVYKQFSDAEKRKLLNAGTNLLAGELNWASLVLVAVRYTVVASRRTKILSPVAFCVNALKDPEKLHRESVDGSLSVTLTTLKGPCRIALGGRR